MPNIIATDIGGTFTDLVSFDTESGSISYSKSLTTYGDLVDGVFDCVDKADVDVAETEVFKHGTTLVINTFVNRSGARTALVTTRGFRDVLEFRRGNRPIPFDLRYRRDPILVEREWRLEVDERMDARGEPLLPLDTDGLDALADQLRVMGVEAVAVSFLNAHTNSAHEEAAVDRLRSRLPGVYVTAGTDISREWYEYERTSTAVANAYVGPGVKAYVDRFARRLSDAGFSRTFYMMGSNGGVLSLERSFQHPVMLVESGPIGGCIGAAVLAEALGIDKAIAFDMGGTTAKCALIEGGNLEVQSPYYVGGYETGFPIRGSVLDIVEVGAGGGSIAWLDDQARLRVGPRSAGSTPGPVAYGRGGTEPTVTDANLWLGRIGSEAFLNGELRLDVDGARRAIVGRIAEPLGYVAGDGADQAAQGILALAALTMADAIKRITIERGRDTRDFAMVAFGGGGPLHAVELARELHIPTVIVPPEPGNFSAVGMLFADARIDTARAFLEPLADDALPRMEALFREMEAEAQQALQKEIGAETIAVERSAEMRYRGQKHSMKTAIGAGGDAASIRAVFEETYRRRYGHADPKAPVEFINLQLSAAAPTRRPDIRRLAVPPETGTAAARTVREVYFPQAGGRLATSVYDRRDLAVGFRAEGPAIVEEYGATTVVGPSDSLEVGALGELRIHIGK